MDSRKSITEGSINRTIIRLALPMVIAFLLQTSFNIVDGIFVGRLGPEALAAVSMAFPIVMLMISLGTGVGIGATSIIARSIGAKHYKKASNVAEHSLLIAVFLSIIFSTMGLLFGKPLFIFMGAEGSLLNLILEYTNIIFSGSIFMFLAFIANNILRGEGNMKVPMYIMGSSAILNIILDPIFIFVLGLGVRGAAFATIISRGVACLIAMTYILRGKSIVKISLKYFKYNFAIVKELFFIGIPTSLSHSLMSVSIFIITMITSRFGVEAIAAYGIGFRLDSIFFLPVIGLMTAVITIVGQNLGAKKVERAYKTTFNASLMAVSFAFVIGFLFFLFRVPLAKLFNNNPLVVSYASMYLSVNAFAYVFIAVTMIVIGSFLGAGKSIQPMIINLLRLVVIAVPLAYFLSSVYGVIGIWIGLATASVTAGIVSVAWFKISDFNKKRNI